jgi:Cell wall-active antibiotics response 4TMS YvqF
MVQGTVFSTGILSLFNRMGINLNGDVLWPLALIGIGSAVLFSKSSAKSPTAQSPSTQSPATQTPSTQSPPTQSALAQTPTAQSASTQSPGASALLNPYPSNTSTFGATSQNFGDAPRTNTPNSSNSFSSPNDLVGTKPTRDDLLAQARREVDELSLHESWLANPIGSPQSSAAPTRISIADPRVSKRFSRSVLGTALVLGGSLAIAIRSGWFVLGSSIDNALAFALIGVGVVLFVGAWFGRPFGFLGLGTLLFVLLAGASFAGTNWGDGVGQRTYQPKSLQELRDHYKLGAGALHLDLSQLSKADFMQGNRVVDINVGAGAVAVELPTDGTAVAVATTTRGGEVTLFGKTNNQTNRKARIGAKAEKPKLTLNVRAGVGAIEVARAGKLVNLTDLDNGSMSFNFSSDHPDNSDTTSKNTNGTTSKNTNGTTSKNTSKNTSNAANAANATGVEETEAVSTEALSTLHRFNNRLVLGMRVSA